MTENTVDRKVIRYLYQQGITKREIINLTWRNVDEFQGGSKTFIDVRRKLTDNIEVVKRVVATGDIGRWFKRAPIYPYYGGPHYVFCYWNENAKNKHAQPEKKRPIPLQMWQLNRLVKDVEVYQEVSLEPTFEWKKPIDKNETMSYYRGIDENIKNLSGERKKRRL